jgi:cell division protease FtsH
LTNSTDIEKDKFKKVIVYNKTEAEVFLKPEALKKRTPKVAKKISLIQNLNTFEIGNDQIFQTN